MDVTTDRYEDDDAQLEASAEQLATLRSLGVEELDLEDLSYADAEAWIDQLQSLRRDAGRLSSD